MDLPTVRVKHPEIEGGVIINESDLSLEHEPADEASALRMEALWPYGLARGVADGSILGLSELDKSVKGSWSGSALNLIDGGSGEPVATTDHLEMSPADVQTLADTANEAAVTERLEEGPPSEAPAVPAEPTPEPAVLDPVYARIARSEALHALKFIELKERAADLGLTIIKTGTTKEDLVNQILNLQDTAGK